jgi:hypothetical protein
MYSAHTVLRIPHDLNYKKHSTILGFWKDWVSLGFVTLCLLEVLLVAYVSGSDFILHIVYAIDACVLAIKMPSLFFIDILYAGDKSDADVGSGRRRPYLN